MIGRGGIMPVREFSLLERDFFAGDPYPVYEWLRREHPVYWHEPGQFWVLSKYADVREVSRAPSTFSSLYGTMIGDALRGAALDVDTPYPTDWGMPAAASLRRVHTSAYMPPDSESLVGSDPPRHTQLRRLINRVFTPRVVAELEPRVRDLTVAALDDIDPGSTVDFVDALAAPVPTYVIAELLGVAKEDRDDFRRWSDAIIASGDEIDADALAAIASDQAELAEYFTAEYEQRRRSPRDDLLSRLATSELDGEPISAPNLLNFAMTLLAAGNETTRNLLSGAARALDEHRDQRTALLEQPGLLETVSDEFLRWVTPVTHFARTAMADTEIAGRAIAKGDYVVMLYASANRDEDVWERADRLDVTRGTDPMHLAFGFGEHLCLGASLARLEIRVVFEELLTRFPRYEVSGPVERVRSTLINGVASMPVQFH